MNKDKYVFSQLIEFLDYNKFRHLVDKYEGNRYVKSFTCWISSWRSCSDNSVIVRFCVMLSIINSSVGFYGIPHVLTLI